MTQIYLQLAKIDAYQSNDSKN